MKQSDDDFCDVCECRETDAIIDCRDRDLVIMPKTFSPDEDSEIPGPPSWSVKVLDLRGNPRLVVVQAGALDSLPHLEELRLPLNLMHLSPVALEQLQSLKEIKFEEEDRFNNFVTSSSGAFSDICCGLGEEKIFQAGSSSASQTLMFCDLEPDAPGIDAVYEDYIQYLNAEVIDSIVPSSTFVSVRRYLESTFLISHLSFSRLVNEFRCLKLLEMLPIAQNTATSAVIADTFRTMPAW